MQIELRWAIIILGVLALIFINERLKIPRKKLLSLLDKNKKNHELKLHIVSWMPIRGAKPDPVNDSYQKDYSIKIENEIYLIRLSPYLVSGTGKEAPSVVTASSQEIIKHLKTKPMVAIKKDS